MRRVMPAVLSLTILFAGCKAKEAFDKVSIAHDLDHRGTSDLLKQTEKDQYTPPADGKLTEAQVQMYLKVRDHEKQIAQVAKQELQQHADAAKKDGEHSLGAMVEGFHSIGSLADMATADIRAAADLHYNTKEYLWVKGQVLAASTSMIAEKVSGAMNAGMDAQYVQMKKAYDEAKDEATKKVYADALANYDKSRQEMHQGEAKVDSAVAYNRDLLSKHENALNAFTAEASKYEDKPGDAQKSMEQWQKDVDKTTADQKKLAGQ